MTNKSVENIKPIAFEFAKAIVTNNPSISKEQLIRKSVEHAVTWLDSDLLIKEVLEKHHPDWVLLQDIKESEIAKYTNPEKKYWVAGNIENKNELTIAIAAYYPVAHSNENKKLYIDNNGNLITGFYILKTSDDYEFDVNKKPDAPKEMKSAFQSQGMRNLVNTMRIR